MLSSILRSLTSILILCFATSASANLVDLKFGQYQVADTQWNVNSCTNTNSCQIYSKNPGTAYMIPWWNGQVQWGYSGNAATEAITFTYHDNIPSSPWSMWHEDGDGFYMAHLGYGNVINLGEDANGVAYFFFVGDDNNTGQLFSVSEGMSSTAGVTFTGTLNPDIATINSFAANYGSTEPLDAGESASTPPPAPTPVYGSSGPTTAQQSGIDSKLALANAGQGNTVEANIFGDDNLVNITQAGGPSYINLMILGNTNAFDIEQNMSDGAHAYNETTIIGANNDVDIIQQGTGNKAAFIKLDGDGINVNVNQKDSGEHFVDLSITGDDHAATILQEGSGNKSATVVLDGSQPWNFDLTQSGASEQNYTLPHGMSDGSAVSGTCSAVGGCNLSVTQN